MRGLGIEPKQQWLHQPVQEPEHDPDRHFRNARGWIQSVRKDAAVGFGEHRVVSVVLDPGRGLMARDSLCMAGG